MGGEAPADTGGFRVGFAAGRYVAGYRLETEISREPSALVYRARDERLGRLVALKILAPDLADDDTFRHWLIGELHAVAAVRSPHLLPVFEAGRADGMLYLAMRYVPGGDARSIIRRAGPMPPGRVAAIAWQAASALDAMHAAGLLHRNVTPANILVDVLPGRQRDWVYLSDFALRRDPASADGRTDQYALAASAFELLTGWPPPGADGGAEPGEAPPGPMSRRPDLPAAAHDVFAQAMAPAPEDRYASCREFAAALAGGLGLRPPPPAVVRSAPRPVGGPPPERIYLAAPGAAPAGEAPAPALAPAAPAPAAGGEPWLVRPQAGGRRRAAAIAALAIAVLAAAGVVVAAGVLRHQPPKPPARLPAFPVAARSTLPPVSGDVWVTYQGAASADAQVYGEVKDAVSGDVARLYAQPFPYTARPVPVASAALHPKGKQAPYTFQVAPAVATRYHVSVFQGRKGRAPLASSAATTTVYVAPGVSRGAATVCTRPTCHETLSLSVFVPAQALGAEITRPWYTYFGLTLSRSPARRPPAPAVLLLGAGGARVAAPRRASADEYVVTVTFSFAIGKKSGYSWLWAACAPASEAADGIGLPGNQGCGAKSIPTAHSYLG